MPGNKELQGGYRYEKKYDGQVFSMLKITFFGTTTLLFDDGRDQILFDAHFTRPSIEGKKGPDP